MQRIEGLSIGLSLDTLKVDSGLKDLKSKMGLLNSELKLNMSAFDRGEKSIDKYSTQLEGLNKKFAAQKVVTESARKHYEKMVKEHGEGSEQAEKAAKEYNNQAAALNNLERYVKNVTKEMQEFQKQQKIQNSGWNKVGESLTNFGNGLKTVSEKAQSVGKNLTKKITLPAVGAASALAGITLAKGFARLVGIDNARAKLKGLGHDAKGVEKIMESALDSVRGTSFGMDEAATTAANAVAAGVEQGKDLTRYLSLTGDAAAIAGSSMSEMGSILNKVKTSNKAYNGELQQLSDRGLPVYQWLAKEAGVAADAVFDLAKDGKISSEMLMNAIEKNIGGAAKKMGEESFTAGVANMWAAVGRLGASFLDAGGKGGGFFSQLKPMIANFTERIDSMGDIAQKAGVKVGEMFTGFIDKIKDMKARYDAMSPAMQDFAKKAALIGTALTVGIGPALGVLGKVGGVVAIASTKLGILSKSIAEAGGFLKWLRLGLTALTGPVGITIAAIVGLSTAFIIAYKKSETFRNMIDGIITKIKAVIKMFKGDWLGGRDMLSKLGMGPDTIRKFENGVIAVKLAFKSVADFFKVQGKVLQDFWKENGDTIGQAVSNIGKVVGAVFKGIWSVIKFVMPSVLAIIKMVWGNIKGVIQGALKIIMGIVQVFSGLFTGNFSKMWTGIKNIFSGALQFIWNYVQLMMWGKLLKGILSLGKLLVNAFKGTWNSIRTSVSNIISNMVNGIGNRFTTMRTTISSIFKKVKENIGNYVSDMVKTVKDMPGRMAKGIKDMGYKLYDSAKGVANRLVKGLGKGVNGVVGGVNWVLKRLNIKTRLDEWPIPEYAHGTKGHSGGLAVVGDGKGSNSGPELIQTPDGQTHLSPAKDTLVNLPRGTKVLPAKLTKQIIPHYADGIGFNVWDYISKPSKLLDLALDKLGIKKPDNADLIGKIARGGFNMVKEKAVDFVKDKFKNAFDFGGTNASGNVKQWIAQAMAITGVPGNWAGPLTTIAMKESGGRTGPSTINKWDSNWRRGTPSMGLMQTIMPTFQAYKKNGFNDIMNPVHNAIAAINYIKARYGTPFNTPGIKSMARGGPYKGYKTGGLIKNAGLYNLAEDGWPEYVIPTDPKRRTDAMKLLALAGKDIQGNKRPQQLPNVGGNDTGVMAKLLDATLEQNRILMQLLRKENDVYLDGDKITSKVNERNALQGLGAYF